MPGTDLQSTAEIFVGHPRNMITRTVDWVNGLSPFVKQGVPVTFMWGGIVADACRWVAGWPWAVIIGGSVSICVAIINRDAKRKEDAAKIHELETQVALLASKVATGSHV